MINIDNLLNDNLEDFRKEVQSDLFSKIKEKLENKKIEIAASLYDDELESDDNYDVSNEAAPEQPD